MLETEDVLIVPGSSFNVPYRNHFRVTLLPQPDDAARSVRAHRPRAGATAEAAAARSRVMRVRR